MLIRPKYQDVYIKLAHDVAQLSYAKKMKVGAVIVKGNRILSFGYNGTPPGWDNNCEDKVFWKEGERTEDYPFEEFSDYDGVLIGRYKLTTKPHVIHAEENAILHLTKSHESSEGTSLFLTHSPCVECFKTILGAGIEEVYYRTKYRCDSGIELLKEGGVKVYNI